MLQQARPSYPVREIGEDDELFAYGAEMRQRTPRGRAEIEIMEMTFRHRCGWDLLEYLEQIRVQSLNALTDAELEQVLAYMRSQVIAAEADDD